MAIIFYGATSKSQNSVGSGSFTFNHDSGNGSNRYLLVHTQGNDTLGTSITGVKYNGVAMTLLVDYIPSGGAFAANCPFIRIWGLANPATGTNSVEVTYVGRSSSAVASTYTGCASVQGARYSILSSTAAANTTQSVTLSGYSGGDTWAVGFASINGSFSATISPGANTNNRASTADLGQFGFINSDNNGNNTVSTLNWSCATGVFWTACIMQLNPIKNSSQMIII